MNRAMFSVACAATAVLMLSKSYGQGPASCGFHLDIRASGTTTHSSVASMPNAPGGGGFPYAPGAAGNPYEAYATPGSFVSMVISGNPLSYGPAPFGSGSCLSILWSPGVPAMVPVPLGAPFLPTCDGSPHVIGILPSLFALIDTCGFLSPAPPFGLYDMGDGRLSWSSVYPVGAPTVSFQVAGIMPGGGCFLTNPVTLHPGSNPNEVALVPTGSCDPSFGPLDEGQSVGNPTPPGFTFYGFPATSIDLDYNGFADFVPGVGAAIAGGCDFGGNYGDLGCPGAPAAAQARPQIAVAHSDFDFSRPLAAPFVPTLTMETRPPGPTWPGAVIYRWNNAPFWNVPNGTAGLNTQAFALELQDTACPGCVPALLPHENRIVVVRSWMSGLGNVLGAMSGIGPGIAGQGFGGPAASCPFGANGAVLMNYYGGAPLLGATAEPLYMSQNNSAALGVLNSAIVFTPTSAAAPCAYQASIH